MVRASFVAVLSAAMSLVAVGCADEAGDGALRIIRNQFIDDESCVVSPTTVLSRGNGAIEAVSPVDYVLTPIVQNSASSQSGKYTAQRTAFLEGARVDLEFSDPNLFTAAEIAQMQTDGLTKFSSPFSATVTPDAGTTGTAIAIIPVELLAKISPKLTAASPSTTVTARVRVYGKMGGGDVEGEQFFYPVRVCDSLKKPGSCTIQSLAPSCTAISNPKIGNPCNPYQDSPVDCCTANGNTVCPTPASSTVTALSSPGLAN